MNRTITLFLGSVLVAVVAVGIANDGGSPEAPAVAEAPELGGLTPLAPDTGEEESFDPSQVQLEPGDPTPDDYIWDENGNLVLRPDFEP